MRETWIGVKMPRFIRVTKDNRNKDRGFIAVDAICAVFENQDSHNTEIMTMDGFWYEVVDGVEKVYADVIGGDKPKEGEKEEKLTSEVEGGKPDKFHFAKNRRFVAPAVSEDATPKSHEESRGFKRRDFSYPKQGYGQKKYGNGRISRAKNFPSGEGEGQHGSRLMAVDFTPPDTEGL